MQIKVSLWGKDNAFQVDASGSVTAKEVTITIDNSNSVKMSDMWNIMSGTAGVTVGGTTYGGAYFTKSNGTSYLNYGGTSNINLNNLGTVMDAMDGKIQNVVDKINELPDDAASNSTTTAKPVCEDDSEGCCSRNSGNASC